MKYLLFGKKWMWISAESGQGQGLWSQNGDTMSPGLGSVLHLVQMSSRQLEIRLQQGQSVGFIGEHN
jgi:hypothetical protein